jgi:hypothetical protein
MRGDVSQTLTRKYVSTIGSMSVNHYEEYTSISNTRSDVGYGYGYGRAYFTYKGSRYVCLDSEYAYKGSRYVCLDSEYALNRKAKAIPKNFQISKNNSVPRQLWSALRGGWTASLGCRSSRNTEKSCDGS